MSHPLLFLLMLLPCISLAHPGGVDKNYCHQESRTGERHCHPERANSGVRYDANHPPEAGDEGVFFGPFVRVVDGDTFHARVQGVVMEFRLEAVEAPEHDQPYGDEATAELSALIQGQQLLLVPSDTDRYGRTVVRAWVGNLDVNRELMRRGAVWFTPEYSKDALLYEEETEARIAKRGLWALPVSRRIEPWRWRRRKK
jgi:micrococcal nuclease